jgi:hypothetical protein
MWVTTLVSIAMTASSVVVHDQDSKVLPQFVGVWDKAADMTCTRDIGVTHDRYGFALATLVALSYAKDANDRGAEVEPAVNSVHDITSVMTELLHINKRQSADVACAEVPFAAFNQPSTDITTRMVAQNFLFTWHQQIQLNDRMNSVTKNLQKIQPSDMADKMSSLQIDRENLWKTLYPMMSLVLLPLIDNKRVSSSHTLPYLLINKVQKTALVAKVREFFPDVEKQKPKDMDPPTFAASLYLALFKGHKASDEV